MDAKKICATTARKNGLIKMEIKHCKRKDACFNEQKTTKLYKLYQRSRSFFIAILKCGKKLKKNTKLKKFRFPILFCF